MKQIKRTALSLALALTMLLPGQSTLAASKKTQAVKAYRRFLEKGIVKDSYTKTRIKNEDLAFSLIYLDKDRSPELIVKWPGSSYSNRWSNGSLYRISQGRVRHVSSLYMMDELKYIPKKGILMDRWSESAGSGCIYARYASGRLKRISGTSVQGSFQRITFRKNTGKNRRKYLR